MVTRSSLFKQGPQAGKTRFAELAYAAGMQRVSGGPESGLSSLGADFM